MYLYHIFSYFRTENYTDVIDNFQWATYVCKWQTQLQNFLRKSSCISTVFFFNQLERQATFFDKQNQNLWMKRAPTRCPTPREIRQ